jgi:hypothetical protein
MRQDLPGGIMHSVDLVERRVSKKGGGGSGCVVVGG